MLHPFYITVTPLVRGVTLFDAEANGERETSVHNKRPPEYFDGLITLHVRVLFHDARSED
jgi:hypothetical protein